jgi:hypothetical protein
MVNITEYQKCSCGAISLYTDNGDAYSCKQKNLRKFFPNIDLRKIERLPETYCCDHCVNHYGLDLCGCGSGEEFGKCEEGYDECKQPMQVFGQYTHVRASDSWI